MELWIRSQDRKEIRPQPKLGIDKLEGLYYIVDRYDFERAYILGRYETKERALEVLDEIQDELIGSDFMPIEKNEEVVLTCGSAKIYEMPEN